MPGKPFQYKYTKLYCRLFCDSNVWPQPSQLRLPFACWFFEMCFSSIFCMSNVWLHTSHIWFSLVWWFFYNMCYHTLLCMSIVCVYSEVFFLHTPRGWKFEEYIRTDNLTLRQTRSMRCLWQYLEGLEVYDWSQINLSLHLTAMLGFMWCLWQNMLVLEVFYWPQANPTLRQTPYDVPVNFSINWP